MTGHQLFRSKHHKPDNFLSIFTAHERKNEKKRYICTAIKMMVS